MKKAILLWMWLMVFAPALHSQFLAKDSLGKVTVVQPAAHILRNEQKVEIGRFGTVVKKGDQIVTGVGGKAQLVTVDGDEILIAPSSRLSFDDQDRAVQQRIKPTISFEGKIRARVMKGDSDRIRFKTANAQIAIKGTEFVAEYKDKITTVGTVEGLVGLSSNTTQASIDIPPGLMSSVSPAGEVMPLSEIAGELMTDVESAGEKLTEEDISGRKM